MPKMMSESEGMLKFLNFMQEGREKKELASCTLSFMLHIN